jgi:cell division protein ZipA
MLRTILLIIGVLIILAIAWDGWRRKRHQQQVGKIKNLEPELNIELDDTEPFIAEESVKKSMGFQSEYDEYSEQASDEKTATSSDNIVSTKFTPQIERDGHLEIEAVDENSSANETRPNTIAPKPDEIHSANEVIPKSRQKVKKEVEPTASPQIVSLTIMPINSRPFAGYDLIKCLQENNLHHGEFSIYHRHKYKNGKGPLYFSVASLVKPGTIDPSQLGTLSAPGLAVFMELNNPKHDRLVFKKMLATSHQMAKELKGIVCDDKRVPLREASIQAYAAKISL